MKKPKIISFFVLIGLLITIIPILVYGVINTMVSLKYETNHPMDCVSIITGQDLCLTIQILKGLVAFCMLTIIMLLAFRKRFLQ